MENYKSKLDEIQNGMLDFMNQEEIDLDELTILMQEYSTTARSIADKLRQYIHDSHKAIPSEFQDHVLQIAHIKNITDLLRQKLAL